jgi:hypothetical protein
LHLSTDFIDELKMTWVQQNSAKLMLHGYSHFMEMEGPDLVHAPPMDGKLTGNLAPLANKGMANPNPSLLNKHCYFSWAQFDKVYWDQGVEVHDHGHIATGLPD